MKDDRAVLADGRLLMHGVMVEWPPKDVYGKPIMIGDQIVGYSTMCLNDLHVFYVGGLRLQYRGARLDWVVCSYEDATDRYFESWAGDCRVLKSTWYMLGVEQ